MNPAVRCAVVGLGYWGPKLARNLHELDCTDLVGVYDHDPERLELLGRRFPGVGRYESYDELLADETLEAVAVATPVSSHYPLARRALEAGKHVFVEKPLAASSRECLELIELAADRNLVLMPGHTFLYSPPVVAIRNLIQSGVLGQLYFVSTSRVNLGLHQPDVSVIWDLGPHDFSILHYWLDERPAHVSTLSRGFVLSQTPDVAFVHLEFPSGTVAHVELSWLAPSKLRRTTIVGSQQMVVYDDTSTEPVRVFDSGVVLPESESFGEYRLTYRTGDIISPRIDATEPLSLEFRDFCAAVTTGSTPRSNAALGLEVVRTIEASDHSARYQGARVPVDAFDTFDPVTLALPYTQEGGAVAASG